MSSRACPNAGIYFSHYECLGHTSRVMAVGEIFKKRFPQGNLFFIQAGLQQPQAKIDALGKIYSLPAPFMDRRHFRETIRGAGLNAESRGRACEGIVNQEKPDLFITEFFPLGREECRHELIPSLIKSSRQGAALWSVAGYPLLTGTDDQWRETFIKMYQRIIIFAPPEEKQFIADSLRTPQERQKYLNFFERYAPKIIFAGYLLPRQEVVRDDSDENLHQPPIPQGVCRVAVLRGAGAYGPKLIAQAIRASDLLGKGYYLTVVAGPATSAQEWYLFTSLVGQKKINNLILLRAVGDYEGLIKKSDVCVSVASYHTSVMMLKHKKKAILVPFEGDGPMSFYEQPARTVMLKEMINAKVLPMRDLTARSLADALKGVASQAKFKTQVPKEFFKGGEVLGKALMRLFPSDT